MREKSNESPAAGWADLEATRELTLSMPQRGMFSRSVALPRVATLTLFLLVCCLRLINLGADTPLGISKDVGLYVDEGYKTLAARNFVLTGEVKVHPADDYEGWFHDSFLTQWAYVAAFKLQGVRIESARTVSIVVYSFFLATFLLVMKSRMSFRPLMLGLFLLGTQSAMFFYSRVALFEIFIVAFLYVPLFLSLRVDVSQGAKLLLIGCFAVSAALLIKASSFIYFVPVFLANASLSKFRNRTFLAGALAAAAVFGGLFTWMFWEELTNRLSGQGAILQAFHFPLTEAAPAAVVAGYFCAFTGLLVKPSSFARSFYQRSLLAIILLAPLFLSLFPYNPLRYYIPILPAYLLVVIEWVRAEAWKGTTDLSHSKSRFAVAGAFALQAFYQFFQTLNVQFLARLPLDIGSDPGISARMAVKLFLPAALVFSAVVLVHRKPILTGKKMLGAFGLLLVFFASFNALRLYSFYKNPSFSSRDIRLALHRLIPGQAVIAGDWAPFLTMNTPFRTLYVNDQFNREKMLVVRPSYILYSENLNSRANVLSLARQPAVSLDAPFRLPDYFDGQLRLYPIIYRNPSPVSAEDRRDD